MSFTIPLILTGTTGSFTTAWMPLYSTSVKVNAKRPSELSLEISWSSTCFADPLFLPRS